MVWVASDDQAKRWTALLELCRSRDQKLKNFKEDCMASNFLFGLVAFVFLYSIIVFIAHYVRAGNTIVTLKRPRGINVLFLSGFILIALAIWTTVSNQPMWEQAALFLSGTHGVMRYLVKPRLSAKGIFWNGTLIPWDNVLSVVRSPNDNKNLLIQYGSSTKRLHSAKLLTIEYTPQVAQTIAQRVPGAEVCGPTAA
jgi:hypothetical protein